jgi:hypothetical protein
MRTRTPDRPKGKRYDDRRVDRGDVPDSDLAIQNTSGLRGADHSNRRPPPEPLNVISDARIDCFEHF